MFSFLFHCNFFYSNFPFFMFFLEFFWNIPIITSHLNLKNKKMNELNKMKQFMWLLYLILFSIFIATWSCCCGCLFSFFFGKTLKSTYSCNFVAYVMYPKNRINAVVTTINNSKVRSDCIWCHRHHHHRMSFVNALKPSTLATHPFVLVKIRIHKLKIVSI